jgi:hypothetical protein|tara:strand:- start:37 stop:498 length:462 start_codon:yes stop_codon:yes gene_type:complete
MAISVSVSPGSGSVVTATERLGTINATVSFESDTVPPETISSVSSTTHTGITMTSGTSSCTLVGTYEDSFTDEFKYVEKGSSDLAGSPTTVIGLDNLPSNKLFYNLNQDATTSVTKSYTVTVTHSGGTDNFTVTHVVNNEYESIRSAVASYYV